MNKKVVTFTIAMVLLLGITLGVTFALMTAETKTLTNTFVAGNFGTLKLYETNADGDLVEADGTTVNTYNIAPGTVINGKDPYVEFTYNTSPVASYVFIEITEGWSFATDEGATTATHQINDKEYGLSFVVDSLWTPLDGVDGVFYYCLPNSTNLTQANIIYNNTVTASESLTAEDMKDLSNIDLTFKAYAIQVVDGKTVGELWTTVSTAAGA